jgi:glycosyl transferase, family 25
MENMIKIFVINLKRSQDRWDNIQRQFQKMRLDPIRFEAIDGKSEQHPLFNLYDSKLSHLCKGRSLTPSQLGCYASHYLIWQECLRLNEPIVVIEDDALVEPELFHAFLSSVGFFPDHYECIRLFKNHSKHHKAIPIQDYENFSIVKYTKGHMRATGYYLTPQGAAKFLKKSACWFMPVDIIMDRFWENQVECYGMMPFCITNDPSFVSTVHMQRRRKGLVTRLKREIFAAKEGLARFVHNRTFQANLNRNRRLRRSDHG